MLLNAFAKTGLFVNCYGKVNLILCKIPATLITLIGLFSTPEPIKKIFFLRPASLRVDSIVILRLNKNIFQENISNILVTTVIFLFWAPISHLTLSWRDLVSFASESKVLEYS